MSEEKTSSKRSLVILSLVCVAIVLVGLIASSKLGLGNGAFFAGVALIVSAIGVIGYLKIFPRTQTLKPTLKPVFHQTQEHRGIPLEIQQEYDATRESLVTKQLSDLTKTVEALSAQLKQVVEANVKTVPIEEQTAQKLKEIELEKANNELKRHQVVAASLDQIRDGVENKTVKATLKANTLTKKEPEESQAIILLSSPESSTPQNLSEMGLTEQKMVEGSEKTVDNFRKTS